MEQTLIKNVEIYIGEYTSSFTPKSKGNDMTYAAYIDAAITASNISNWKKLSGLSNEVKLDPAENDVSTKSFFGSDAAGSQNAIVTNTIDSDVDITLNIEDVLDGGLESYAMEKSSATHANVDDYEAYALGTLNTDNKVIVIKVRKLVGAVYYFRTYVILDPEFKKPHEFGGASDDESLTSEYTLVSTKGNTLFDMYNDTTDETLVNF